MGSLGRAGMLPARRMAEHRTFIMSQVATVYLADMDLRDHQLRCNERDVSGLKPPRLMGLARGKIAPEGS